MSPTDIAVVDKPRENISMRNKKGVNPVKEGLRKTPMELCKTCPELVNEGKYQSCNTSLSVKAKLMPVS